MVITVYIKSQCAASYTHLRTKHFINAFGEELIVDNAEKGLSKACAATGAQIVDYSAAPVFMDEHAKCRHQWLIEFAKKPDDLDKFAKILDDTLKEVRCV